jgi:hypothetical protein
LRSVLDSKANQSHYTIVSGLLRPLKEAPTDVYGSAVKRLYMKAVWGTLWLSFK